MEGVYHDTDFEDAKLSSKKPSDSSTVNSFDEKIQLTLN